MYFLGEMLFQLVILLGILCDKSFTRSYHGFYVGDFSPQGTVQGKVYIADETRLLLSSFSLSEENSAGASFYVKFSSDPSPTVPNTDGHLVTHNGTGAIGAPPDETFILTLPEEKSTKDLSLLYVWSAQQGPSLASVQFITVNVPTAEHVGTLKEGYHQVAGNVTILSHKTIFISGFTYDGLEPPAVFWVGKGRPGKYGEQASITDEHGNSAHNLGFYHMMNVTVTLPRDLSIFDIDYLAVYSLMYDQNFGEILFSDTNQLNVPFYLGQHTAVRNCEPLSDLLNLAWEINENDNLIEIELTAALKDKESYIAFGISGSSTESLMAGADVTIVYHTSDYEMTAVDYFLSAYTKCSNGSGACPDLTQTGGSNDAVYIGSSFEDGITKVIYSRPIESQDTSDRNFIRENQTQIIWSIGPIDVEEKVVLKHVEKISGHHSIHFFREPADNCSAVEDRTEKVEVISWQVPNIQGTRNNTEFVVALGPPGGNRGYRSQTDRPSPGLAYYINGLLIPEIYLKRGTKYSFIAHTGDDAKTPMHYHPFYISDDPVGGYVDKSQVEKESVQVFAGIDREGNPTATGHYCEYKPKYGIDQAMNSKTFQEYAETLELVCDEGKPGIVYFTPTASTPDELYYQSYTHKFLGWKIHVTDDSQNVRPEISDTTESFDDFIGEFGDGDLVSAFGCLDFTDSLRIGWSITAGSNYSNTKANFTFTLVLPPGRYVAFGASDTYHVEMINADVIVVTRGDEVKATDYTLTAYQQCVNGTGACPNNQSAPLVILEEKEENGILTVKVHKDGFTPGHSFEEGMFYQMTLLWALGPYDAEEDLIQKHDSRSESETPTYIKIMHEVGCPVDFSSSSTAASVTDENKIGNIGEGSDSAGTALKTLWSVWRYLLAMAMWYCVF